ncbi:hypothetical protein MCOR02_007849 [Pyricularia oryzae]|nr:hypothetical protein MCOR02_007849 [Pyricularia oryzae]
MSYEPQPPSLLYPNAAAAEEALKDFALQNGFDLIIAERYPRGSGDNCTRLTFRCVRGRAAKQKPANTAATAAALLRPPPALAVQPQAIMPPPQPTAAGTTTTTRGRRRWHAGEKTPAGPVPDDGLPHRGSGGPGLLQGHNHDLCLPTAFSTFRHRNLRRHEARILELYRQGRKPREILAQIEKDIGAARRGTARGGTAVVGVESRWITTGRGWVLVPGYAEYVAEEEEGWVVGGSWGGS